MVFVMIAILQKVDLNILNFKFEVSNFRNFEKEKTCDFDYYLLE